MDRKSSKNLFAFFLMVSVLLTAGDLGGIEPAWIFHLLMIITFPGLLLSLFFLWNAPDEEQDNPFMGY